MRLKKLNFLHSGHKHKKDILYIFIGTAIGVLSMLYSTYIIRQLALKEINEIKLWSHSMTMAPKAISDFNDNNMQNQRFNQLLA
ncbi:MAG: hypothetical protein R3Y04_09130, partial [Rikenellaceae bacterium]